MDELATSPPERPFDLIERTARFGETAIHFARKVRRDDVSSPLVRQFVRAATSIGANYTAADESGSKKEFRYRISLCCRESRETQHWLRMLAAACPDHAEQARELWQEARQLTKVFSTIHQRSRPRPK
jgi:four helix bundle protein